MSSLLNSEQGSAPHPVEANKNEEEVQNVVEIENEPHIGEEMELQADQSIEVQGCN